MDISTDSSSLFSELSKEMQLHPKVEISEEVVDISNRFKKSIHKKSEELKETFDYTIQFTEQKESEIVLEEVIVDSIPEVIIEEVKQPVIDLIQQSVESITKYQKHISEHTDLFNQPNVPKIDPTLKALQSKIKYLEDWIVKISMTGPGSGEVRLKNLDDVDRNTLGDGKILQYAASLNKFIWVTPALQYDIHTTTVTTSTYSVSSVDEYVGVQSTTTTPVTITLVPYPAVKRIYIKDEGRNASKNNITLISSVGTVEGSSSIVMTKDGESLTLIFNGTNWNIV